MLFYDYTTSSGEWARGKSENGGKEYHKDGRRRPALLSFVNDSKAHQNQEDEYRGITRLQGVPYIFYAKEGIEGHGYSGCQHQGCAAGTDGSKKCFYAGVFEQTI